MMIFSSILWLLCPVAGHLLFGASLSSYRMGHQSVKGSLWLAFSDTILAACTMVDWDYVKDRDFPTTNTIM